MDKTIIIYKTDRGWMSEHLVDGKPNPVIRQLFGTHHIPTPFTYDASGVDVRELIQKLNPESEVLIRS